MKLSSKLLLLLLITAIMPQAAWCYDFKEGGLCYNINDDGKSVTMTYERLIMFAHDAPAPTFKGYIGHVGIPEKVEHEGKSYKVTAIDDYAFSCNTELQMVVIPRTVKNVGREAFAYCSRLEKVMLPPDLTAISENMFAESAVREVIIPAKVKSIGKRAFNNCYLKSIDIPGSVKTIGEGAFSACRWMETVTLGKGVETIGDGAFSICTSLKTISLPASLRTIGDRAFYECGSMEQLSIPASVTKIGDGAFSNCGKLATVNVEPGNKKYDSRQNCNAIIETATNTLVAGFETSVIPQSVTGIGAQAFAGCRNMEQVTIPTSVTSIGGQAFFYCTSIRHLVISNSVTTINERAFCGCDSLLTVEIGNSVTRIGYGAFLHDDHIKAVTIGSAVKAIDAWAFKGLDDVTSITSLIQDVSGVAMGKDVFDEIDKKACTLYVPAGTAQHYKAAPQWKEFVNIVEQ